MYEAVKNPSATRASARLQVSELYRSIQGESTHAGRPCAFVRLTGCPLRCVWCDTTFAFHGGRPMTIEAILDRVAALGVGLVEVTGGEPLAQAECLDLLAALCDAGYEVLLETSGAIDVAPVDPRVVKILDVKCPGSGEVESNRWENLEALGPRDEIKFVLADRADYEWARETIRRLKLERRFALLLSPVHDRLDPADLAAWMLADAIEARLQIQLHKQIWPGKEREV
jgi:7-carboxy-7-deazaguanine synthase